MKIALDYDLTYTKDKGLWRTFIHFAKLMGHDVRIVTTRSGELDRLSPEQLREDIPVIYCDGVAKRFVCTHYANWIPDVWIDDKPQGIDNNSTASPEVLVEWRKSEAHDV